MYLHRSVSLSSLSSYRSATLQPGYRLSEYGSLEIVVQVPTPRLTTRAESNPILFSSSQACESPTAPTLSTIPCNLVQQPLINWRGIVDRIQKYIHPFATTVKYIPIGLGVVGGLYAMYMLVFGSNRDGEEMVNIESMQQQFMIRMAFKCHFNCCIH